MWGGAGSEGLVRRCEYVGRRELEEPSTGKASWSCFDGRCPSRESLTGRFCQLAELRNGIRHSRTVGEIARKDGEAALLWFEQVLASQKPAGSE